MKKFLQILIEKNLKKIQLFFPLHHINYHLFLPIGIPALNKFPTPEV